MDSAVELGRANGTGKKRNGKAVALVGNLRDASKAKAFCRDYIEHLAAENMAASIATIGAHSVNEYLVLKEMIGDTEALRFTGISSNSQLIEDARQDHPSDHWCIHDVSRQHPDSRLQSDIVYSQHLLEHCPGLDPALSNMLSLSRRVFIHIFSLPPRKDEQIQWQQYPEYRNYYSAAHIRKILCAHRFDAKLLTFVNDDLPGFGEGTPPSEVVLIALKKEDSDSRPEFEYDAIPELTRE